ncbi:MAG: PTS sugar transporter subunit IIA [Ghiorsea sp.]|nr:PTS sugar transporter subunit IIA [Ghiorsea sp.]
MVGHARIASETKLAVEHILGQQTQFQAVDFVNSDNSDQHGIHVSKVLDGLDEGHGVLILVDLMGATPWNMVNHIVEGKQHAHLLGGFNVPAVVRAMSLRQTCTDLNQLAQSSVEAGKHYMRLKIGGQKSG